MAATSVKRSKRRQLSAHERRAIRKMIVRHQGLQQIARKLKRPLSTVVSHVRRPPCPLGDWQSAAERAFQRLLHQKTSKKCKKHGSIVRGWRVQEDCAHEEPTEEEVSKGTTAENRSASPTENLVQNQCQNVQNYVLGAHCCGSPTTAPDFSVRRC